MTLNAKRAMLNPTAVIVQTVVIFAILWLFAYLLNKWSLQRDADPAARDRAELRPLAHQV